MDLTIWHQRSGKKKPDSGTYWCVLYLDLIQFLAGSLPMSQNLRYKVEVAAKLFSKGDNDSPLPMPCRVRRALPCGRRKTRALCRGSGRTSVAAYR